MNNVEAVDALCIGGPKHGEIITLADSRIDPGCVLFPIMPRLEAGYLTGEPTYIPVPVARYHRDYTIDKRAVLIYDGIQNG